MPMKPDGTFARNWKFAEEFHPGDSLTRVALDAAFDDVLEGLDAALKQADRRIYTREEAEVSIISSKSEILWIFHDQELLAFSRGGNALRTGDGAWWGPSGTANIRHWGARGDFDWASNAGTDNTEAIRKAVATGGNVIVPDGLFRVTGEIEIVTPGQIITFEGRGTGYGEDIGVHWQERTGLVATGSFPRRVRTRRKWRGSAADPQDDPISVVLNVQAEGVVLERPAIHLYCDYTDTSHTNLGDDCDVGIFIGCRVHVQVKSPTCTGYFRKFGYQLDVTGHTQLPRHLALDGTPYPEGTVKNGADGCYIETPYIRGPMVGIGVIGAEPKPGEDSYSDDYYDEQSGMTVTDRRGSFGASDFTIVQGRVYGPDHHSNRRLHDPNSGMGNLDEATMMAEPDSAPAAMYIDGLAGNSDHALWGMRFYSTRFATFEAFRVRLARASRCEFYGTHIEGRGGMGRMTTTGAPLNANDYANSTYGQIAGTKATQDTIVVGLTTPTLNLLAPHYYRQRKPFYLSSSGRMFGVDYIQSDGEDLDLRADPGYKVRARIGETSVFEADEAGINLRGGLAYSGTVTVEDDGIADIIPPNLGGHFALTCLGDSGNWPQSLQSGILFYDVGTTESVAKMSGGSRLDVSSGSLNGTSGQDTYTTVAAPGGLGALRIENRSGQQQLYRFLFF